MEHQIIYPLISDQYYKDHFIPRPNILLVCVWGTQSLQEQFYGLKVYGVESKVVILDSVKTSRPWLCRPEVTMSVTRGT